MLRGVGERSPRDNLTMNSAGCLVELACGIRQKCPEHRFVVVAVVPLPDPLVQVPRHPPGRDVVMRPAHIGLEVPEETFDRVRMHVAFDIDALRMTDAAELEAVPFERVVATPIVGTDIFDSPGSDL